MSAWSVIPLIMVPILPRKVASSTRLSQVMAGLTIIIWVLFFVYQVRFGQSNRPVKLSKDHASRVSKAGLQYCGNISTYYMTVATGHNRAMLNHNHALQYRGDYLPYHRLYL